jgi:hypothetical protein
MVNAPVVSRPLTMTSTRWPMPTVTTNFNISTSGSVRQEGEGRKWVRTLGIIWLDWDEIYSDNRHVVSID